MTNWTIWIAIFLYFSWNFTYKKVQKKKKLELILDEQLGSSCVVFEILLKIRNMGEFVADRTSRVFLMWFYCVLFVNLLNLALLSRVISLFWNVLCKSVGEVRLSHNGHFGLGTLFMKLLNVEKDKFLKFELRRLCTNWTLWICFMFMKLLHMKKLSLNLWTHFVCIFLESPILLKNLKITCKLCKLCKLCDFVINFGSEHTLVNLAL